MRNFLHSVRLRLTVWYAAVLAVALALFAASVYLFVVRTVQTNVDEVLRSYAQQMHSSAVHQVSGRSLNVKKVAVPKVGVRDPIAAFMVMSVEGHAKAVVRAGHPSPAYQELRVALHSGHESCGTFHVSGKKDSLSPFRFCTRLVYNQGKRVGAVEVVESLSGVDRALERLRLALLLGIPFVLLLAGSGGWILAGRALEPVDDVTQMARSITATDLSRRINLDRQDELGRLADTFDEMIDRLDRAFQEQRQLTADVSHELRSPLTILEAQTTLALKRARSAEEYRQVLVSVQEEVERMSAMVHQLLMLARADSGEEVVLLEAIALSAVAKPVVEGMAPLAEERGVVLTLSAENDAWIEGDASRLRQLLLNLLDNALRHTADGDRIDITIEGIDGLAMLRVADTGEGIAPEDLPHIFQRFYRGDRARRRAGGNAGLGLSIVRWIVEAHGGEIEVHSEPGKGATFTAVFPAVSSPAPAPPVQYVTQTALADS